MKSTFVLASAFIAASHLAAALKWCKDGKCSDCPSALTSSGPGYPDCVIYDSKTVFGGQGFEEGEGKIKFKVWADIADPCDGTPGSYMVRSPASLTTVGCGNLIYHTENAECSTQLSLEDTFMIQYCCGSGDCDKANVPWGKRDGGGGMQGAVLKFKNGTVIPPLAIGPPPVASQPARRRNLDKRDCDGGWLKDSYIASGAPYIKTFETQIVSAGVAAGEEDRIITITYDQSVSRSTSFDLSVGDPFGIVSLSVGMEFTDTENKGFTVQVTVPAGTAGRIGFTPAFRCTSGSLEKCDGGRTGKQETCTPYVENGIVQGDYAVVQT
ncbi:hypothetical protein V494_05431 [Pseudogymnoascus sp. VKM F-4513 (FW-928)]|nr:hypothetical protein V494_05431 [Pseudogymnoascus sp. VKM F-4513 (FW-928)]